MTYGTRAGMALARAHGMGTCRLLTSQNTGCHLLSETSAMHAYGLGSLAGTFALSVPPAARTIGVTSWGALSSNGPVM